MLSPAWVGAHGGFDVRIESANRAVAAQPSNPEPRLIRAELHRRHGDFAAALLDLDEADQLSKSPGKIDYFRGLVQLDAARYPEAESHLRRFLETHPRHPAGHQALARALLKQERARAAAREYDLAIAHQPVPVPDDYLNRARALEIAHDFEGAIRGIDQGLARMGPIVTLERAAIDLELQRGATDAALARLDLITQRSARRESGLAQRGEILAQAGRTEEAAKSFALALAEFDRLSSRKRRTPATAQLEAEIRKAMAAGRDADGSGGVSRGAASAAQAPSPKAPLGPSAIGAGEAVDEIERSADRLRGPQSHEGGVLRERTASGEPFVGSLSRPNRGVRPDTTLQG